MNLSPEAVEEKTSLSEEILTGIKVFLAQEEVFPRLDLSEPQASVVYTVQKAWFIKSTSGQGVRNRSKQGLRYEKNKYLFLGPLTIRQKEYQVYGCNTKNAVIGKVDKGTTLLGLN